MVTVYQTYLWSHKSNAFHPSMYYITFYIHLHSLFSIHSYHSKYAITIKLFYYNMYVAKLPVRTMDGPPRS